ncbi:CrcB family protein [Nesterenkonia alkaliphila]|uniref:Fluoride-specific ion channel n=1 Tax=Nesterenkonia alkaliphila TaxID=1463631 RepID=A0A7K1UI81_9MICC|nr:CrcB family protein [Nesterenkonia alkaliphila]MVT26159.1 CrcB family protein [Nesterenkonia alkaliphila]
MPALVFWVAVAGACGAVLRLLLVELSDEQYMRFPWATLMINLAGSGALGTLVGLAHAWRRLPQWALPVLGTGFLGSFTTFSAVILAGAAAQQRDLFAQVASSLVVPPEMWEVGAYLVISMLFCTAASAAGLTLGRAVFGCTGMDCAHAGGGPR